MTEKIHPHGIMADFVNKYPDIKKVLGEEKKKLAKILIGEVYSRFEVALEVSDIILESNPDAYFHYVSAVSVLHNLWTEKTSRKTTDFLLFVVDKSVKKLEDTLQNDEHYKKYRKREE